MKFQELTENEIIELTAEQLQTKIKEIEKIYKILTNMSVALIKKKLIEINYGDYYKTIEIEPSYEPFEYITEDYESDKKTFCSHYRVRIDNLNWGYGPTLSYDISEKLMPLRPLSFFFAEKISFDICKLKKIEHVLQKLEEKPIQTKPLYKKNSRYIFQVLTENEILKLTQEQLQEKIKEISEIYDVINRMSIFIAEKKLKNVITRYDIKTVSIKPFCDEMYKGANDYYRVFIDNDNIYDDYQKSTKIVPKCYKNTEDISFLDLQKKIISKLELLKFFIKEELSYNIPELRIKYLHRKLEKDIPTQNLHKKIKSSFYKI